MCVACVCTLLSDPRVYACAATTQLALPTLCTQVPSQLCDQRLSSLRGGQVVTSAGGHFGAECTPTPCVHVQMNGRAYFVLALSDFHFAS